MDIDLDGDIVLDDRAEAQAENDVELDQFMSSIPDTPPTMVTSGPNDGDERPAAYDEPLVPFDLRPTYINLQWNHLISVNNIGNKELVAYLIEHLQRRPKNIEWVNDWAVNLQFSNPQEVGNFLHALTHRDEGSPGLIQPQASRKAREFSERPDIEFVARLANTGDVKERGAAKKSQFYKDNPRARHTRKQEYHDHDLDKTIRPDKKAHLDYGYDPNRSRSQSTSGDSATNNQAIDSYRPDSNMYPESRSGRLRGRTDTRAGRLRDRSDSPVASEDGRLGFDEYGRNYRERSRDRRQRSVSPRDRRRGYRNRDRESRKSRSSPPWEKDPSVYDYNDVSVVKMSHHRRSDAKDETSKVGSIISRMSKNGKPLVLNNAPSKPSLQDRMTRDGPESSYGRLKDDYTIPQETTFDSDTGFNIRGKGSKNVNGKGEFSIRGAAGGI